MCNNKNNFDSYEASVTSLCMSICIKQYWTVLQSFVLRHLLAVHSRVLWYLLLYCYLQTHFKDEDKAFPVYEEVREELEEDDISAEYSDEDDDVNSDLEGYSLKNSYIEEKEEALIALKEFAVEAKYV
jgi:hypothetical protein